MINHISFEIHDVVVKGIVPFTKQLNDCKFLFVIGKKDFYV